MTDKSIISQNLPELMNAKELATKLSLSLSQIRKMTQRREIPVYCIGRRCRRYSYKEVYEVLQSRRRLYHWSLQNLQALQHIALLLN